MLHSGISLSVSYQVGLVVCARVYTVLSLEFAIFSQTLGSCMEHALTNSALYNLLSPSKDQYGLHSDQFPGHPDGVNALIPITDNVVITGCEDGNIRAVHLYPHR